MALGEQKLDLALGEQKLDLALGEQKLDLALGRADVPNRLSVKGVGLSFFTLSLSLFLLSGFTLIKVF